MPDKDLTDDVLDEIIAGAKTAMEQYLALSLKAERAVLQPGNSAQPVTVPAGYVLVPIEPTESMIINGFESEPDESFSEPDVWEAYEAMSGCQQAAHRAKLCWAAMIAAAPKGV